MEYKVYRKKIKNYIIRIYPDKSIKISVPLRATSTDIANFISSKKEWIEKTLMKFENKIKNDDETKIKILNLYRIKKYVQSEIDMFRLTEKSLYIYYRQDSFKNIEKLIEEWKIKILKEIIDRSLDKYTKLLKISIEYYKIKKLNSAWGIYHTRKNYITFNIELIEKSEKCIDYVVLHELCHFFYPNHQKEFWNLIEKFMPNYKSVRQLLKD